MRYNTWRWLLLDYLEREQDADAKGFLNQYLQQHGADMIVELERQRLANHGIQGLSSPYTRGAMQKPDYEALLSDLRRLVPQTSETPLRTEASQTHERKRKDSQGAQYATEP